jgi:elongation of very long chain fatty acids protein 6
MVYSWYSYPLLVAPGRYFILVNCSVHAIMYTYYALRASRLVRIPRFINVSITLIQMSQMVVGVVVNALAYYYRTNGEFCSTTDRNLQVALLMYSSYFFLFAHYFYQAYFVRSPVKPSPKPVMEKESNGVAHSNGRHTESKHTNGVHANGVNAYKLD